MESPVDKEPVDSITEELERPLLDQFSTKNYSSDEDTSDTYVSEPMFEDDPSMTTDATDVTLYARSCPDFECMRGTPVTMFEEGHTDVIRRHDTRSSRSTRSCPSLIFKDTHVTEPMYEECSTMTSEIARDTYVTPSCARSCPDFECMRGTPVTMFEEGHTDVIRRHDTRSSRSTRSCPSLIFKDTHVTEPMYEECSTMTSEIARDTYVTPSWDLNMKWGHGSAPFSQVQRQTENLNMEWGYGSAVFFPAQRQIESHDVEWGHEADPQQTQCQTKIRDILRNHLKSAPQVAPPQTDIGDLESGREAAPQENTIGDLDSGREAAPQENTIGDLESGRKAAPQQPPQENTIGDLNKGHEATPKQSPQQTKDLNMKWGHGSAPFSQVQRQTENLNMEWGHGAAVFSQRQIENHDVEWGDEADVEWDHEADPQQAQCQTKVDDPASDMIYIVRLLLAMYMIMLPYLGWGHGSDRRQTENHDVEGGTGPDPQQTRRQTKVDDPASDVMYIVRSLLIIYNIMLAYLGWGPTSQSPRQKYMILYWVSIGMVSYAIVAVLVVLKLYKMGGAWTWWATFFRYTISLAALIGCIVLLVFVSRH